MFDTDISGGIFAATGIIAIVLGEYPMFTWYGYALGWSIGLVLLSLAFFKIFSVLTTNFEDDEEDEDWILPF